MGRVGNFNDIIESFADTYTAWVVTDWTTDENGGRKNCYKKVKVRGSLQTGGRRRIVSSDGASSIEHTWDLFANRRFILNEGDYLKDKNGNILIVNEVDPWEVEGSYRKYTLLRTTMTERRILDQFVGDINPDADLPNPQLEALLRERTLK